MLIKDGRIRWSGLALGVAVLAGLVAGCDDSNDSGRITVPESQLEFVRLSVTAPDLETMDTSFWAVAGEDSRLEIRFQGQGGPGSGKKFLELRVDDGSLLRRPNGTPFAEGDSIEIRVVVDPEFILASFEPSGLTFNPNKPAELEIEYEEAEQDFLDREIEFDMWRQEQPGDPWELLGSAQIEDLDEIEAELLGFTRFALAIGR